MRTVLLLAAILLSASAVAMEVQVEGAPEAPLDPEVESAEVTAVALIGCDEAVPRIGAEGALELTWQVTAPPQVIVVGPGSALVDTTPCLTAPLDPIRAEQAFTVTVTRDLLAFQDTPIHVTAVLQGGQLGEPVEADTEFMVQADAYLLFQPKIPVKAKQADHGEATFEIELSNFGNARTRIDFSLAEGPESKIFLPDAVILDSPNREGGKAEITVEVVVRTDGSHLAAQVVMTPSAADDPSKVGDPTSANILAQDRSILKNATPAPAVAPILLLALALVAATRRFPRNDR